MIPIGDSPRRRITPVINWALIIINVVVFLYELSLPTERQLDRFFFEWGVVPVEFVSFWQQPSFDQIGLLARLITSQFLHGGWLHILGNMLFLWVFGDNVEDAMGHVRYLIFYLLSGVLASLTHIAFNLNSQIPAVGASGAIAGVMGAYLILYPTAIVQVLVPVFFFFWTAHVPALLLIGIWFLLQLFSGIAAIGYATGGEAGIAFWAHVGGFLAGLVLVFFFRQRGRTARVYPRRYEF